MNIRKRWRRIRLYYKRWSIFKTHLQNPIRALFLPLISSARFRAKNGIEFTVPGDSWFVLPNFVRLASIGAKPSIVDGMKRIEIRNLVLYSPIETNEEGNFLREIFIEDVYRIRDLDLTGKVVVDIGGYIGDTAIAFGAKGATVYVLEPSARLYSFIQRNIIENQQEFLIHAFPVGLSNKTETITCSHGGILNDRIELVDGIDFVLSKIPTDIEYLKLDCEGCEYHLLGDDRFLAHLKPRRIVMEFHHGLMELPQILENAGYRIEIIGGHKQVGYIYAEKM